MSTASGTSVELKTTDAACVAYIAVAGPPEELYCSDPSTAPEDTLTEIRFPVAKT